MTWQAIETLREIVDEVAGGYDENDPTFAQEWAALSVVEEALEAADVVVGRLYAGPSSWGSEVQTARLKLARAREGIKP